MKIRILFVWLIASTSLNSGARAQQTSNAERSGLQRVEEEVAKRRKIREAAQGTLGSAFAPFALPDSWYKEPRTLKIDDSPLVTCGQTFANLVRKEVLISGRVVQKRISILVEGATAETAMERFRVAIEAQGVVILPIGSRTLVLVEAADLKK